MTLTVNAYSIDENGLPVDLEFPSDSNDLAGTESSRKSFYASAIALKLDLKLLPMLASHACIKIEGSQLDELEAEVLLLINNLSQFNDDGYFEFRLKNILAAITLAKPYGPNGGVYIG